MKRLLADAVIAPSLVGVGTVSVKQSAVVSVDAVLYTGSLAIGVLVGLTGLAIGVLRTLIVYREWKQGKKIQ